MMQFFIPINDRVSVAVRFEQIFYKPLAMNGCGNPITLLHLDFLQIQHEVQQQGIARRASTTLDYAVTICGWFGRTWEKVKAGVTPYVLIGRMVVTTVFGGVNMNPSIEFELYTCSILLDMD